MSVFHESTGSIKQIKTGAVKNFIVLSGEDDAQVRQAFHATLSALDIQMPELNLSVFEDRPEPFSGGAFS